MAASPPRAPDGGPLAHGRSGWLVLAGALAPALAAVWLVPWFVTQDGPAHLYNAAIIAASFEPGSAYGAYFTVRWQALPNWAGHLLTAALLRIAPPRWADRALMTLTLAGFAAAVTWLRARVAGTHGLWLTALKAALLGLNLTWLFGFTSFLLGACLFPLTLGAWWSRRNDLSWGHVAGLSLLLVVGYFCHLVSLGLTVIGLVVLALLTPGPSWAPRAIRTATALAPLAPLGLVYLAQSRQGGALRPVWEQLRDPLSPAAWARQLSNADPVTLALRQTFPFVAHPSRWFGLLMPAFWLVLALCLIGLAILLQRDPGTRPRLKERRGWWMLAGLLLAGGIAGPGSFGSNHGDYLPPRLVLLGLVALLPALDLEAVFQSTAPRALARFAGALLAGAVAVQSAVVWDYALASHDRVGGFVRARAAIQPGQRVATLLNHFRGRFRVNPLLHADCLVGLDTRSIIWSDYETRYYYFPVQFRSGLDRPHSNDLEVISVAGDSPDTAARARAWRNLLAAHHGVIDRLLVWGTDAELDPISAQWFETVFEDGATRVLRPRAAGAAGPATSAATVRTASSRSASP